MEIKAQNVLLKIVLFVSFGFYLCGGTQCDSNCTDCDTSDSSGSCRHCQDGFYPIRGNCIYCTFPKCKTCSNASNCDSCKDGFWGEKCDAQCAEGCVDRKCNINNGFCSCLTNFYGNKCDGICSDHCVPSTCFGASGNCVCKQGYFGGACRSQCGNYCTDCTNITSCSLCETGKFGSSCQINCKCDGNACDIVTGMCLPCGTDCLSCNNNVCTSCVSGKYGDRCEHTCSSTCYDVCDNQGHCQSCKSGYYGHQCEFGCNCEFGCDKVHGKCEIKACPINCNGTCDDSTQICNACNDGYHGPYCNITCPGKCDESRCYTNGSCLSCEPGYYGNSCNMECQQMCESNKCHQKDGSCGVCPANCVSCESKSTCTLCKESFYGQICHLSCNDECADKTCNIKGVCFNCSLESAFGSYCNLTCNHDCYLSTCDRNTGACHSCKNNSVFGMFCNETCSPFCLGNECKRESGVCLNGCRDGYFGTICDQECSQGCRNNSGTICDLEGACLGGCTEGYVGKRCKSDTQTDELLSTSNTSTIAAIVGGIGGVVVTAALVVTILFLLRKRKTRKPYEEYTDSVGNEYNTIGPVSDGTPKTKTFPKTSEYSPTRYDTAANIVMIGENLEAPEEEELEIDLDEERRTHKRKLAKKVEENVYYIGIQDIEKRKVKVEELAAFVAGKTLDYYEEEFDKFSDGLTRSCDVAKLPRNREKNRYKGLYAYDDTRVKVIGFDTDYINANYIDGFKERNAYIASLGPMSKQMGDFGMFWNMISQQKVEKIVMVTNLMEEGKEKCEQYWPNVGITKDYSGVKVTCQSEDAYAEFTRRLLLLNDGKSERQLHHLHFTAWPDRGIPEDVTALIEFRQRVLNSPAHLDGPTLVHCSAGIGRTGTYIALDILTKEGNSNKAVEIPGCIMTMRQNRPNMVQTTEQYEFLHLALVHTLSFNCEQIPEKQFQDYMIETSKGDLIRQFKKIMDTPHVHTDDEIVAKERNKSEKGKNRSVADIPGDEYRPRLYLGIRHGDSDYVNAVFAHAFQAKRKYIVAQSPLPNTVQDFLTLAYQENCSCIVSFEQSDGKKDIGEYYPADNQVLKKGQLSISCERDKVKNEYSIQKWLTIEFKGSTQGEGGKSTLRHFEFTDWNQTGNVPCSPANYVAFLRDVKMASSNKPVLVHCRDGGSKSGLFCVMAFLMEKMVVEHEVSVVNAVRKVKARRPNAVANQAQFDFCHDCVLEFVRSFKPYYNFRGEI
ncbi:receptor-type tyrosine-protein phosphatase kappa-like [Mya arenaria]|uniref:receptor-type tyrosine-protein phosphatase kappa-like n=1 Tax=Mya arenaria TaxID=6604 RepID=UPI0022E80648|nr:receptor-type tyrosine-protein phosphatase kappa-like [Mya arenaria]